MILWTTGTISESVDEGLNSDVCGPDFSQSHDGNCRPAGRSSGYGVIYSARGISSSHLRPTNHHQDLPTFSCLLNRDQFVRFDCPVNDEKGQASWYSPFAFEIIQKSTFTFYKPPPYPIKNIIRMNCWNRCKQMIIHAYRRNDNFIIEMNLHLICAA